MNENALRAHDPPAKGWRISRSGVMSNEEQILFSLCKIHGGVSAVSCSALLVISLVYLKIQCIGLPLCCSRELELS